MARLELRFVSLQQARSAAVGAGWVWRRLRTTWPFVLLAIAIVPLLWMGTATAVRAGLFAFAGPASTSTQLGAFLTFIGTSLGTVATVFAALLTRAHNARERQRLRLETVVKSLEMLPEDAEKARFAGVLSTMVLLGQERIAMRVLLPAWEDGKVDEATATWLLGQVLTGGRAAEAADGDRVDAVAMREAAVLLVRHADRLPSNKAGQFAFVGHYLRHWKTRNHLPPEAKMAVLQAMATVLIARDPTWWNSAGGLPRWPTEVLAECARREPNRNVRNTSAVLLAALRDRFPEEFDKRVLGNRMKSGLAQEKKGVTREFREIAETIRGGWRPPSANGEAQEVELTGQ